MSDYNLGTASGRIEVDGRAAVLGFRVAESAAQAFFGVLGAKVKDVQQLGRRLATVGAAGVGGFGLAVKAASKFETQLSGVRAVTGSVGEEFDAIRQKALDLGEATVYSASEAAFAIEELAKAGIPVPDILNGAADAAVALAAAGGVSLPEAATIAANAMNQFGLEAEEVGNIADYLAGVANTSAADVGSIGTSLSQVGAVANLAGLSFRDTAIAIGEMSDAGINGSDAGTSLKTMLNNLIPSTDKQRGAFKDLGLLTYDLAAANKTLTQQGLKQVKSIDAAKNSLGKYIEELGKGKQGSVKNAKEVDLLLQKYGGLTNQFFDTKGKIKDLGQVQEVMRKALAGLSEDVFDANGKMKSYAEIQEGIANGTIDATNAQKLANLELLFGADAMRAAAIMSKQGAAGYKAFSDDVAKTKAADVAAIRLDNLSGSVEAFKGSMETAMITVGSVFLPALSKIVNGATWLVNAFNNLPGPIKTAIAVLALIASTGMLVVGAILALLPVIAGMVANFLVMKTLGFVFVFFRTLVGHARRGTLSLATFRATAATTGGTMKVFAGRLGIAGKALLVFGRSARIAWIALTGPIGIAVAVIAGLVALGVKLYKEWAPFRNLVNSIGAAIKTVFINSLNALKPALESVKAAWADFMKALAGTGIFTAIQKIGDAFNKNAGPAMTKFQGVMQKLMPIVRTVGMFLLKVFAGTVVEAFKGIGQVIEGTIKIFTGLINFFTGLFTGNWQQMWDGIKQIFSGALGTILGALRVWLAVGILKLFKLGFMLIKSIVMLGWTVIKSLFRSGSSALIGIVRAPFSIIGGLIRGYIRIWMAIIRTGWAIIKGIFLTTLRVLKAIVTGNFRAIPGIITGAMGRVLSVVKGAWNRVRSSVGDALKRIGKAVTDGFKGVLSTLKSFPGKAVSGIGDLKRVLYEKGVDLIRGLIAGITDKIGDAVAAVKGGLDKIGSFLPGSPIKDGPLVSWNRGGAGKRLMGFLTEGIQAEAGRTAAAAARAAQATSDAFNTHLLAKGVDVTSTLGITATPLPSPVAAPRPTPTAGAKPVSLRMVRGTLSIDASGRAFISGVAQEVFDENEGHADTMSRMGGR